MKKLITLLIAIVFSISLMAQMTLQFNTNFSDGKTVTLPLYGTVDVTVDWGDGNFNTFTSPGDINHTYDIEGIYSVKITGSLTQFGTENEEYTNAEKLEKVDSFGNLGLESLSGAFCGTTNLTEVPVMLPSTVTDLSYTFHKTGKTNITNLNNWDVSNVTTMNAMFLYARDFNQDIGSWNVSNVTDMSNVFNCAYDFNQDIGSWDVSNATIMNSMFRCANNFNHDIGSWNVVNVTTMNSMFEEAFVFNQDIGSWDVGNVTYMNKMFHCAYVFNQDIGGWDVSSVTNMFYMFPLSRFNHDIGNWDVSNVTNMGSLFSLSLFNQDISGWDVSNVTNMDGMFASAENFNYDISGWDVSNVTDMGYMFIDAFHFNYDISGWDVSNVTNMSHMFWGAHYFNQNIGCWDVSNVTNMRYMFCDAWNFDQDISGWDVSNVTDMYGMFCGTALSTVNYNKLLIGWSAIELQNDIIFEGGYSKYGGPDASSAREYIISTFNWTITDGGERPTIFWEGSLDSDWNKAGNWSVGEVPTISDIVVINQATNNPIIDITNAACTNLTINLGGNLTINSGSALTICGNMVNYGKFKLNSDLLATASLIIKGDATGNITAQRFLTQDIQHYISVPVNDTRVFSDFLNLTNGADNDQFYWWDEDGTEGGVTGVWFDILNDNGGVSYAEDSFVVGQGYNIAYGSSSETINFFGTPLTTNQTINITKTDASTLEGWNLVGNPFTSSIAANGSADANSFLTTNSAILDNNHNAIYLWNEQTDIDENRYDYLTISNSEVKKNIEVGQAFMIAKKDLGTSELFFNTNMRKHDSATFYKNIEQDEVSRFYMSVENEEGLYNEILIAFIDGMTNGLDISYDAGKLKGNPNIALYTALVEDNGIDFAHQALPPLIEDAVEVKIGVDVSTSGNYIFKIKELQNFDEKTNVILEDKESGNLIDFREIGEYDFDISQPGQIRDRFVLYFNKLTGIEERLSENICFYVYDNKLYVIDKELKSGTIQILNLLGQPVFEKYFSEAVNTLDINLPTGYYIVKIISDKNILSRKVYID